MRVLFTSTPGASHIQLLIPLAKAVQERGHELRFATPQASHHIVASAGIEPVVAGISIAEWRALGKFPDLARAVDPLERTIMLHTSFARGVMPARVLADLLPQLDEWRPDVIVRDSLEFGGYLAGEMLGIPTSVGAFIWFYPPDLREPLDAALNRLRTEHGLSPVPSPHTPYPWLALPAMPRSWVAEDEWFPPTTHFLRPVPYNQWQNDPLPSWFDDLPDLPIVHASLGTTEIAGGNMHFFTALVDALRDEPVNLLLAGGRFEILRNYGPLPANVRVEAYFPHNLLLPRCAVFITHAGHGSAMAALSLGLPMVAVPQGGDQFRNARHLADLGAAIALNPDDVAPDSLRAAVREVLTNRSFRLAAARMRDEIAALPGPEHGVELLEQATR